MERKNNYDLLKIFCALAVIAMHVSGFYVDSYNSVDSFSELYTKNINFTCIFFTFSRFAVPCFVMLAGAFALSNEKNLEWKYYYKKIGKNIIIPTIVFSILYLIYSCILRVPEFKNQNYNLKVFIEPFKNVLYGKPFYHMWYMYMIIPVYLCVPFLIQLKTKYKKYFSKFSIIFLILCSISAITSTYNINWSIGMSCCYLGFFLIGNVIYEKFLVVHNKKKALAYICVCFAILGILYFMILYMGILPNNKDTLDFLVNPYNPIIVVASILMFIGISMIKIKINLIKISSQLMDIYMIHALVWDIMSRGIRKFFGINGNNIIIIPMSIIIVFIISLVLSYMYKYIENIVYKKTKKVLKVNE